MQYLKSSLGGHFSERNRAGHVKQKTCLRIFCLFCDCEGAVFEEEKDDEDEDTDIESEEEIEEVFELF